MVDMGMDLLTVKDFLEERCIFEENAETVLDYLNDPSYVNVLRVKQ